jgi:type IV secretory pathway TraG/TraD family ATPase VirD4
MAFQGRASSALFHGPRSIWKGAAVRPHQPRLSGLQPAAGSPPREREVRDVQNIADVLVDPEGALERRNHWEKTSHSLLVGAMLHVLYAERDMTLAGVASFLSDPIAADFVGERSRSSESFTKIFLRIGIW